MDKKVGCTRKIKLTHRGPAEFTNARAWGRSFDSAYVEASPLPAEPPSGAFILPEIEGWLLNCEGAALAELARGKHVLEIGSYLGLSTVCLARTAERVVSVDPHDGRGTPFPQGTLKGFLANLERYGVADKVVALANTLADAGLEVLPDRYELVLIDGAHDAESVAADLAVARDLLAPGGLIAFHDYAEQYPGVRAAVDSLVASGGKFVSLTGSLAVVRPPAAVPQLLEV